MYKISFLFRSQRYSFSFLFTRINMWGYINNSVHKCNENLFFINNIFYLVIRFVTLTFYRAAWNLAIRILSVRPFFCLSVRLTNVWIVTKWKKDLSRFLYHSKDHSVWFSEKKYGWWGRPLLPEILGQPAPVKAKIFGFNFRGCTFRW